MNVLNEMISTISSMSLYELMQSTAPVLYWINLVIIALTFMLMFLRKFIVKNMEK